MLFFPSMNPSTAYRQVRFSQSADNGKTDKPIFLRHGFETSPSQDPPRNSFTASDRNPVTPILDVRTAQIPGEPDLAIDVQDLPSGPNGLTHINKVMLDKLTDIPTVLRKNNKGILLVGRAENYDDGEIGAIKQLSRQVPKGIFLVMAKNDELSWFTIFTGQTSVLSHEGFALNRVLDQLQRGWSS